MLTIIFQESSTLLIHLLYFSEAEKRSAQSSCSVSANTYKTSTPHIFQTTLLLFAQLSSWSDIASHVLNIRNGSLKKQFNLTIEDTREGYATADYILNYVIDGVVQRNASLGV